MSFRVCLLEREQLGGVDTGQQSGDGTDVWLTKYCHNTVHKLYNVYKLCRHTATTNSSTDGLACQL